MSDDRDYKPVPMKSAGQVMVMTPEQHLELQSEIKTLRQYVNELSKCLLRYVLDSCGDGDQAGYTGTFTPENYWDREACAALVLAGKLLKEDVR